MLSTGMPVACRGGYQLQEAFSALAVMAAIVMAV